MSNSNTIQKLKFKVNKYGLAVLFYTIPIGYLTIFNQFNFLFSGIVNGYALGILIPITIRLMLNINHTVKYKNQLVETAKTNQVPTFYPENEKEFGFIVLVVYNLLLAIFFVGLQWIQQDFIGLREMSIINYHTFELVSYTFTSLLVTLNLKYNFNNFVMCEYPKPIIKELVM